jgi:taurine dioxygenase
MNDHTRGHSSRPGAGAVSPLAGPFGVEVRDANDSGLAAEDLLALVHRHHLLVLRGLQLDAPALQTLAAGLGELDVYPFSDPLPGTPHVVAVTKDPDDAFNFGGAWHTDSSYLPRPPGLTLLYAVTVPGLGGDTLFADMTAAFAALSPGMQALLRQLAGNNTSSLVHSAAGAHAQVAGSQPSGQSADQVFSATHPAVRLHPVTGREALYVSAIHTAQFDGLTREESLPLIEFLQSFAVRPERVVRLQWDPGTLAIWDNRAVQHYPLNDYPGERREMHRVIVRGERPAGRSAP